MCSEFASASRENCMNIVSRRFLRSVALDSVAAGPGPQQMPPPSAASEVFAVSDGVRTPFASIDLKIKMENQT